MELPPSLEDVHKRIQLMRHIDRFIVPKFEDLRGTDKVRKRGALHDIGNESAALLSDVTDAESRANIALRLWSGYIHAAFEISDTVKHERRSNNFRKIDYICQFDPIFKAGVESAPLYKKQLCEKISFDGVPEDSPVRKHQDD